MSRFALVFWAGLALGPELGAQPGSFALDRATPGTLGESLELRYAGARAGSSLWALVGPKRTVTPLPGGGKLDIDPAWAALWFSAPAGSGTGSVRWPIPDLATLHGAVVHFQALTLSARIDQVSNPVTAQLGRGGTWSTLPGRLPAGRALATVLRRDTKAGPRVVLAGGADWPGRLRALATSEDFAARDLRVAGPGPALAGARVLHAAVELPGGRTLVAGGLGANGAVLASCEIFDPLKGAFTPAAPMATPRVGHVAAPLPDGRVLVVGGTSSSQIQRVMTSVLATSEIYDPKTDRWSAGPALPRALLVPALTRLSDGRLLLSGGMFPVRQFGILLPRTSNACWRLDPRTMRWSPAASMRRARAFHQRSTVAIPPDRRWGNGPLVFTDGGVLLDSRDLLRLGSIGGAEVYDEVKNVWTTILPPFGRPYTKRALHSVTRMGDGSLLIVGGSETGIPLPRAVAFVERYIPGRRTLQELAPLRRARFGHAAWTGTDGAVYVAGGQDGATNPDSIEVYRAPRRF